MPSHALLRRDTKYRQPLKITWSLKKNMVKKINICGSDTTVHRPDKTPRLTQNAENTDQYFLLSKKDADTLHIGGGGQFMDSYSYGWIWLHTVKLPS
jgi:hypothetical protein